MRTAVALVLAVAACSAPAPTPPPMRPVLPPEAPIDAGTAAVAAPRPSIAILGITADDAADTATAAALTDALRAAVRTRDSSFELAPNTARELAEMTHLATCRSESAACIGAIGADLGAAWLVYGHLDRDHAQLRLALMEVSARVNRRAIVHPVTADAVATAIVAFERLTEGVPLHGSR